ncbi:NAD(P)/FAD-dependent oxidoreductase [Streptomyces sp. NPDC059255]|uniref:NAD(P)/FAD-dependent oxidoreductase n=1 Tax=Streptomyces sp. NPDC059255 TaxID=3346793 RepID=UPI003697FECF
MTPHPPPLPRPAPSSKAPRPSQPSRAPHRRPASAVVVGGGVIGLCCAHYLSLAGLDVTVLERDRLGSGASRGNAGEVCPDLVEPLGAPGVAAKALMGMARADSPLAVRPTPHPELLGFLARLGRHSTRHHHARGAAALGALARDTFELFEELEAAGVDGRADKDGYLFAYPTARSAARALEGFRQLGAPVAAGGILGPGALAEREPALGSAARAGFLVERQWSLDPSLFVDGLAGRLRRGGVTLVEGARVTAVRRRGARTEVRTSAGTYGADVTVIAAGVWSRELCRGLGVDIDLLPGKGYSFSAPAARLPARLIHLGAAKAVLTPLGDRLRVAGTMEFDRDPDRFRQRRVEAIVAAVRPYLRGVEWDRREQEWMGPRPMTPDGLPLIGWLPGRPGVLLATGHNMLGLMLAPATGRLVGALVTGGAGDAAAGAAGDGTAAAVAAAFGPARGARRYRGALTRP